MKTYKITHFGGESEEKRGDSAHLTPDGLLSIYDGDKQLIYSSRNILRFEKVEPK